MCEQERLAMFHFWREVGLRMGIRDIPADYATFERFSADYETQNYRYTDTNQRVGTATLNMFASWFPGFSGPLIRQSMYAMLDDAVIEGFGFPKPLPFLRRVVPASLRLRGRVLCWLPPRRHPRMRTEMRHRSYPAGYTIETLGPTEQTGSRQ